MTEQNNNSDIPFPLLFLDNDDLLGKIKNQYDQDSFFRLILEDSTHYRNSKQEEH